MKEKPNYLECGWSEHHVNGLWVSMKELDVESLKGRKTSVMQYTCQACGERWFTKIKDK